MPADVQHYAKAALGWLVTICYPLAIVLWYLAVSILFVLKLLYRPVAILLQPIVYLCRFILACLVAPVTFAAKFETLYIYLGVAAIVGLLGGLFVRSIYSVLRSLLQLDRRPIPKPEGRTIKQYRAQKQEQKKRKTEETALLSPRHLSPASLSPGSVSVSDSGGRRGRRPRSLLAQTILEDDESDF